MVAQIDHFARWLSFLILLVAGLLLVYGYYVGHMPFAELCGGEGYAPEGIVTPAGNLAPLARAAAL